MPGPDVPVGKYPAGTGNEGFCLYQGPAPWSSLGAIIAAQSQVVVLDLSTTTPAILPLGSVFPGGALLGLDLLGALWIRTPDGRRHLAVNSLMGWTGLSTWIPSSNSWGSYFEDGSTSDITAIGGGPTSPGFVLAGGGVSVLLPTATNWSTSGYLSTPGFTVSAYQHTPNGRILTVDSNGALGLVDPLVTPSTWTSVGTVGSDPRRIRFAGGVGVVSNDQSDSLTVVTWPGGTGTPTIVGSVPVGDGPVGIDARQQNGQVWVASTGYNGNTFTLTIFDTAGAVVSNKTSPAPAGCTNPGHAAFVEASSAPSGLRIAFTAHGSTANGLCVVDLPP